MRVLWFSVTPSLYNDETNEHGGGGWIAALERILTSSHTIELGVAFLNNKAGNRRVVKNNTVYYPMYIKRSFLQRIYDKFSYKNIDPLILEQCVECIEDFKPDIIQIFGSEFCFGMLTKYTNKPIVIHMQGCFPPYNNAQYPPGISPLSYALTFWNSPKKLIGLFLRSHLFNERSNREEFILSNNSYFMGRTRWDKALVKLYSPKANYFYCTEALREEFYKSNSWKKTNDKIFRIVSVGAGHLLKGYDVVLKAAKLLKNHSELTFEWILVGPQTASLKSIEKLTKIKCSAVNVVAVGKKTADELVQILLRSDLFVHSSYIDNSSNAICEAQYLGLPIIATNSGGTPSLFPSKYDNSLLVPTNDPYYLASKILEMAYDSNKLMMASCLNFSEAHDRHNPEVIKMSLIDIYEKIINHHN